MNLMSKYHVDTCFDGVDTARQRYELFTDDTLAGNQKDVAKQR